jgi:hypothetical protein
VAALVSAMTPFTFFLVALSADWHAARAPVARQRARARSLQLALQLPRRLGGAPAPAARRHAAGARSSSARVRVPHARTSVAKVRSDVDAWLSASARTGPDAAAPPRTSATGFSPIRLALSAADAAKADAVCTLRTWKERQGEAREHSGCN